MPRFPAHPSPGYSRPRATLAARRAQPTALITRLQIVQSGALTRNGPAHEIAAAAPAPIAPPGIVLLTAMQRARLHVEAGAVVQVRDGTRLVTVVVAKAPAVAVDGMNATNSILIAPDLGAPGGADRRPLPVSAIVRP